MKYHCYIGAYESIYNCTVEADTPVQAATMAAQRHHLTGRWTVVPGEPAYVDVAEHAAYSAALAVPGESS